MSSVTSKERVLAAINLQEQDRVPMDFSANKATLERLLKDLDYPDLLGLIKTLGTDIVDLRGVVDPVYKGRVPEKRELANGVSENYWGWRTKIEQTATDPEEMFCEFILTNKKYEENHQHLWPQVDWFDFSDFGQSLEKWQGLAVMASGPKKLIEENLSCEDMRVYWVRADNLDPENPVPEFRQTRQLYNLDVTPYESIMLGMFSIWQGPENPKAKSLGLHKRNDILLGFSRDGFHFSRPDRRRFISCTWDETSWRFGNVQSSIGSPLVVGDKLYFYFSGRAKRSTGMYDRDGKNTKHWGGNVATGLAIIRRDGFASIDADSEGGTLTTRPVTFTGKYLFVNVDCPAGQLKAEVLDINNNVIAPFTLANCNPVSTDSTKTPLTWKKDLSALAGQPIRFRFHLTNASLYAFWVSPSQSGASFGYVAGGGPGISGARYTTGAPSTITKSRPIMRR